MVNEKNRMTATEVRAEQEAREKAADTARVDQERRLREGEDAIVLTQDRDFLRTITNTWDGLIAVASKREKVRFCVLAAVAVERATPLLKTVISDAKERGFQIEVTGLSSDPPGHRAVAGRRAPDPFGMGGFPKDPCEVFDGGGSCGWFPGSLPALGPHPRAGSYTRGYLIVRW